MIMNAIDKINLAEKFTLFADHWSPKIVGELNGQYVKLAKLQGEFVWHQHEHEDELFLVIKGQLTIQFRDKTVIINPGEFCIVPRGVEHNPVANEETHILLFEPKEILHTGNVLHERTVHTLETI